MDNTRNIKINFRGSAIKKCERWDAQTCGIFWNFVCLPDQHDRGEIIEGVCAPETRVVARGQVDSGTGRILKDRELVDDASCPRQY